MSNSFLKTYLISCLLYSLAWAESACWVTQACPGGGGEAIQLSSLSLPLALRAAAAGIGPGFMGEQWCQPDAGEAGLSSLA